MQTAHQKTYSGQRKEGLEILDTQVEGSDEGPGGLMKEESAEEIGKVNQNWAGEKGKR